MSRGIIAVVLIVVALLALPLASRLFGTEPKQHAEFGVTAPLHVAAAHGEQGEMERLLNEGADLVAVDENGKTPLHLAAEHGHVQTTMWLLDRGADANAMDARGRRALDCALENGHSETAAAIRPFTTRPASEPTAIAADTTQRLNPDLKYSDLASFEAAIGQPACLIESEHVYMFAPKYREKAANIVMPYLTRAYDALYSIVGVHTQYIIVVYNFPPGHGDAFGGTSNCTLWYDDTNLDLAQQVEWTTYSVPHVSGYIEEMAHNFVSATHAQFGWEMVGWGIGVAASASTAPSPIFAKDIGGTRQKQAETFCRYREQGFTFPWDVEPNLVDRIHAHILWECEQEYGASFWKDVFDEIRKEKQALLEAVDDRDRRYQITIECFDRLPGLHFKQRLAANQISLTRDIKSLNPTEPGWNRRLQ